MRFTFVAIFVTVCALASAAVVCNNGSGGNNHCYELIQSTATRWPDALTAAATKTYLDWDAYLVTITSDQEQNFLTSFIAAAPNKYSYIWIAATDRDTEGNWKWAAGPEAGTTFWTSANGCTGYCHWSNGEPNNDGGQGNYAHMNSLASQTQGQWNDIQLTDPGQAYIVEYSPRAPPPEEAGCVACKSALRASTCAKLPGSIGCN
eukprot:TRINITY_DN1737_c0_g1_i1.p1 TRINITY_DN1737_c0_g1~~TRINITY_DN1737_c0_g1_i1.p1  ORF type:complete len:205 (-),score=30.40 TRINITY_DN1737_c0_g1_i1:45-659(-)